MADEGSDDPGEHELRRLLGSVDRPRALHDDELSRIRGRVEGLGASPSPATAPDPVEIPSHAAAPEPNPFRGRLVALAAAAAIVIIGLIVFSRGERIWYVLGIEGSEARVPARDLRSFVERCLAARRRD